MRLFELTIPFPCHTDPLSDAPQPVWPVTTLLDSADMDPFHHARDVRWESTDLETVCAHTCVHMQEYLGGLGHRAMLARLQ